MKLHPSRLIDDRGTKLEPRVGTRDCVVLSEAPLLPSNIHKPTRTGQTRIEPMDPAAR